MMQPITLADGYVYLGFPELGSTSDYARDLASDWFVDGNEPVWIHAGVQTAGRGRRGRIWESRAGNLSATLLMQPACTAQKGAELSFVIAVALADVIKALAPTGDVQLKWPNDVLLGGKKVSGILLESAASGPGDLDWLSIGCGVNLAFYPEETEFPATSLFAETAINIEPTQFLQSLSQAFAKRLEAWQTSGFEAIRQVWLTRAKGLGQEVTARLASETVLGRFMDLDETGALVLQLADGTTRKITAGEVFFNEH